ncbi:hypothetical protein BV898_06570 [Hypsibius exemplaris]|uniref:Uncharacterized protein n=1 Tax=Hypsibius exemplaris TaxID=2072580 RepID=A0A1W0WVV6_HYPEX|nr:hypothetical protein BV898_06570 [Hypsibius exemplaris]
MERTKRKLSSPTPQENPARRKPCSALSENDFSDSRQRHHQVAPPSPTSGVGGAPLSYDADESDTDEMAPIFSPEKRRNAQVGDADGTYQARDDGCQTYISMPNDFDFSHCMEVIRQMSSGSTGIAAQAVNWSHRDKEFSPTDGSESDGFGEFSSFMDDNAVSSRHRLGSIDQTKMITSLGLHTPNLSPIRYDDDDPQSGTQNGQENIRMKSPGVSPIRSLSMSFCDISSP